jgi:hypothetical protein
MPKHRSTVYTVVREKAHTVKAAQYVAFQAPWEFSCIVGTYATISRAEEVAGACMQGMRDEGFTDDEFRFSVKASTWYDE